MIHKAHRIHSLVPHLHQLSFGKATYGSQFDGKIMIHAGIKHMNQYDRIHSQSELSISKMAMKNRSPYCWDYDIGESEFRAMLAGELTIGRLGQDWAVVRILEYATYPEIIHILGYRRLIDGWPRWRKNIRSDSRKRGFDFLTAWIPVHHPELLTDR